MSDDKNSKPFDFRDLPAAVDKEGNFPPVTLSTHPAHADHLVAARHYLTDAPLPNHDRPWHTAMHACAKAAAVSDTYANSKLLAFEQAFATVIAGIVRTYEQPDLPELDVQMEHAYINNAWAALNKAMQYFRTKHPKLCAQYGVPSWGVMENALEPLFNEAHKHIEHPDTDMPKPRQVTRIGELTRAAKLRGMQPAEAQAWATLQTTLATAENPAAAKMGANESQPTNTVSHTRRQTSPIASGVCNALRAVTGANGKSWCDEVDRVFRSLRAEYDEAMESADNGITSNDFSDRLDALVQAKTEFDASLDALANEFIMQRVRAEPCTLKSNKPYASMVLAYGTLYHLLPVESRTALLDTEALRQAPMRDQFVASATTALDTLMFTLTIQPGQR